MAYVDETLLEDDQGAQSGGPSIPGGGGSSTGSQLTSTAGAGAGAGSSSKKTPGNFADLSEYMRVNSPQQFGTQLAGKVGEDIDKGNQTLSNAETEFKNRVDTNTVKDTQGLTQQVGTDPLNINADDYAKIRDAQYGGPVNLADAQDLNSQVQGTAGSAVGKAGASKTESGRFALLDNYFGRPTYSQGEKSLDNLLVQNDPNSKQAFAQMQQNASTLQNNVNQAGVDLGNYGGQGKAATEATRSGARGALGIDDNGNIIDGAGALGGLQSEVTGQYQNKLSQQQSDVQAIKDAFSSNDFSKLTDAQRSMVGGIKDPYSSYYRVDPNEFLSSDTLTQQNTATGEQQQKYDALSKLAGTQNTLLPAGDDVGKYASDDGVNYDFGGLTSALNSGNQQYKSQLDRTLNQTSYTGAPTPMASGQGKSVLAFYDTTGAPKDSNGNPVFAGPTQALAAADHAIQMATAAIQKGLGNKEQNQRDLNTLNAYKAQVQADIQKSTQDVNSYWGVK